MGNDYNNVMFWLCVLAIWIMLILGVMLIAVE